MVPEKVKVGEITISPRKLKKYEIEKRIKANKLPGAASTKAQFKQNGGVRWDEE